MRANSDLFNENKTFFFLSFRFFSSSFFFFGTQTLWLCIFFKIHKMGSSDDQLVEGEGVLESERARERESERSQSERRAGNEETPYIKIQIIVCSFSF